MTIAGGLAMQGVVLLFVAVILLFIGLGHTWKSDARPWYLGASWAFAGAAFFFTLAIWAEVF